MGEPRAALPGPAEFRRQEELRRKLAATTLAAAEARVVNGGKLAASNSSATPAAQGVCRICFEDIGAEDGVTPCECKSDGVHTVAHRHCVQHWISLRPNLPQHSLARCDPNTCECCGAAWKQTYEVPEPEVVMPTRDQLDARA